MPAPLIDYGECLRDSPRFRQQLGQNEESLEELESRMEKLLKLCGAMVEGGRAWVAQQAQFQAGLWELSAHFATDQEAETTENLNRMIQSLQEVKLHLRYQHPCLSRIFLTFTLAGDQVPKHSTGPGKQVHFEKPDRLLERGHEADEGDERLLQQDFQRLGLCSQQECRCLKV